jgi:hypothetical protein
MENKILEENTMKKKIFIVSVISILLAYAGIISATEKFGVTIYPGAKPDSEATKVVAQMSKGGGECYRTNDNLAKVTDFYKKQPGMEFIGGDKEGAMFRKGKVDITLQNPWMDMKTGKKNTDTLISIVNQQ